MGLLSLNAMAQKLTEYVDPFIGTTNFSVCNPGAVLPHGLMSVVPFNVMGSDLNTYDKDARWWSAPYEYHNKYLTGFAHVTLSGVGCPELGTLLTMPTSGKLSVDYHDYGSEYDGEQARPGYYGVNLKKYGIRAEVTSTLRSSRERFTMPKGEGHLLLNIGDGLTNETGGMVRRVNNQEIEGMRLLGTFCYNPQAVFPIYFVMRVNKLPKEQGAWKQQPTRQGVKGEWDPDNGRLKLYKNYTRELAGDGIGYYYSFDCEEGEQVEVSMGVSFVSIENAHRSASRQGMGADTWAHLRQGRHGCTTPHILHGSLPYTAPPEYPAGLQRRLPCHGARRDAQHQGQPLHGVLTLGHLPQRASAPDLALPRQADGHGTVNDRHV